MARRETVFKNVVTSAMKTQNPENGIDVKNADLVWFDYETRLRKLVSDLLEPSLKRSIQDRELYDILFKKFEEQSKKIEELEFIVCKSQKRQTVFDEIHKKINDLDTSRKVEERNVYQEIEKLTKTADNINFETRRNAENTKVVEKLVEQIQGDFSKANSLMSDFRYNISQMVDRVETEITRNAEDLKLARIEMESKLTRTGTEMKELAGTLQQHNSSLVTLKSEILEANTQVQVFEKTIDEMKYSLMNFTKQIESLKTNIFKIEDVEMKQKTLENYIEKYLPLFVQAQISDTLHNCLSSKNLKRLVGFEDKRFKELNSDILNDEGDGKLEKRKQRVNEMLEQVFKRTAKMSLNHLASMSKAAASDSKSLGIPLQSAKATESSRSKGLQPSSMDFSKQDSVEEHLHSHEDDEEVITRRGGLSSKASKASRVKSKTLHKSDSSSSDEDSDEDEAKNSIRPEDHRRLKDDINAELKKFKADILDKFNRLTREQLEGQDNFNYMLKSAYEDFEKSLEKELEVKFMDDKVMGVAEFGSKTVTYLKSLSEIVVNLIDSINYLYVLNFKEEEDKKSISLLGASGDRPESRTGTGQLPSVLNGTKVGEEDFMNNQSILSQDWKCLSCSGQGKVIQAALKVACLAYKPSRITIGGRSVPRREFLEIAFDSFRPSITFSAKFRSAQNFLAHFENETRLASSRAFRFETPKRDDGSERIRAMSNTSGKFYQKNSQKTPNNFGGITQGQRIFPKPPSKNLNNSFMG